MIISLMFGLVKTRGRWTIEKGKGRAPSLNEKRTTVLNSFTPRRRTARELDRRRERDGHFTERKRDHSTFAYYTLVGVKREVLRRPTISTERFSALLHKRKNREGKQGRQGRAPVRKPEDENWAANNDRPKSLKKSLP